MIIFRSFHYPDDPIPNRNHEDKFIHIIFALVTLHIGSFGRIHVPEEFCYILF